MLETISAADCLAPAVPSRVPPEHSSAVSAEAQNLERQAIDSMHQLEDSEMLFGRKRKLINEINEIMEECSEPDWDGEGAESIDDGAVYRAMLFIRALPSSLPLPEPSPEPDGSVSLDWIVSPYRLLSVSFSSNNRIVYASMRGSDCNHGVVEFVSTVPLVVCQQIIATTGGVNVAVGSARASRSQ